MGLSLGFYAAFGLGMLVVPDAAGAENPAESNFQRALAAIDAGRAKVAEATGSDRGGKPEEMKRRLTEARREFLAAKKILEVVQSQADARARQLASRLEAPDDSATALKRQETRRQSLEVGLYQAGVLYEMGKTWPSDAPERKEHLAASSRKYHELYENHATVAGGLFARYWEARIVGELGRHGEAAAILTEFLTLPATEEEFRRLRDRAVCLLLETYLLPEVADYPEAIRCAALWAGSARSGSPMESEALRIHYLAGRAAFEYARSLPSGDAKREENLVAARKSLEFVARCRGAAQRDARRLLSDPLFGDWFEQLRPPASFDEARFRGDFAWERLLVIQEGFAATRRREDEHTPADSGRLGEAQRARGIARRYYRDALRIADPETPVEELNETRFRLAYLSWAEGDWTRAAVLAEFLVRRYPEGSFARPAAEIAAKAYRLLLRSAGTDEVRGAVAGRLDRLSQLARTYWPDSDWLGAGGAKDLERNNPSPH